MENKEEILGGNGQAPPDAPDDDQSMPILPECIGLEYEDIRAMLAKEHDTLVCKDDPMLMVVSILNVFLTELEKVSRKHNETTGKVMARHTLEFVKSVKSTTDSLGEVLKEKSVEEIKKVFDAHGDALQANRLNNRWCAAIIAISALVNVAALALRACGQ